MWFGKVLTYGRCVPICKHDEWLSRGDESFGLVWKVLTMVQVVLAHYVSYLVICNCEHKMFIGNRKGQARTPCAIDWEQ